MSKTYYKVVWAHRHSGGKLYSSSTSGKAKVEYKLNKKSFPNEGCGPLCVFDSLKAASIFIYIDLYLVNHAVEVFEAKAKLSKQNKVWIPDWTTSYIYELPEGTKLAAWVKLKKEVKVKKWKWWV